LALPSDGTTAFISYSREDSEFVLRMARDLKAAGANVWLDQLDIQPGQRWARALQDAITNAPRFLVILSPASVNSTNVEDEVSFALEEHKTIIPVLYCDCKVPFQLRPYQYADFRTDYDRGLKILLHTMGVEAPAGGVAAVVDAPKKVQPKVSDADEQARGAEQTRMEESRVLTAISTRLEEQKQAAEQAQLEETRLAAERARLQDEQRLATEKARREEEAKQAAEQARLVEARKAAELAAAEKKRKEAAEQLQREAAARKAAEQAAAEKKRKEATEKARLDEEARLAAERAAAEKKRKEAAERARGEEEAKRAQARVEQESKAAATVKADQEKGPVLLRPVGKYAIGAAALVFAGIVYFWLFKDTKPAPAPVVSHARVLSNKPPANDGQINGMAANGTNVPTPGMANGIPNGNIHANPNGMANGAGTGGETGRAALLGEHRLSLQWISWEKFGTATVVDNDGVLVLKGSQHVGDEYLTVEGTVTSVEPKKFTMHGVIVTKIDSINKGQPCRRSGDMTFAIIGARKFWRMQQVDNPCEAVTDYVDIYLR
jgi:hypothetical protein